ncbi:dipeptidase PepV [Bacillus aquiflavi]|uniref:dipeptidase PepV n=1 Tax=Bacillus aquiflavi TaxID=2672567 RepID=UPI001CA957F7|nr:dipeptidase PepV [Bacillus aquiflavi]UAC47600.1 dipeptidase PepV [Bacillus aquiflavi]
MKEINWMKEVEKSKTSLLEDTQQLLKIKSVLDEENATPDAPLGEGVKEALQFMLNLGEKDGFKAKNVDHLAGHLEFGEGEELIGILCHVDVVPEGDGWSSDPYGAEIRDGKIFARGAIDDKGPTLAAYYGMKIVKELGLPISKRVRMIIGTDEESKWRCVEHYFQHEEMPTMGFAPDADFPIIYAEKGVADIELAQLPVQVEKKENEIEVVSFSAGRRKNMVPDFATCSLNIDGNQIEIIQQFDQFVKEHSLKSKYYVDKGDLILEVEGVSAHGMEPENGKNAGLYLSLFLSKLDLEAQAAQYFQFVTQYFMNDSRGRKLGVAFSDHITGELTINAGVLSYKDKAGGMLGLSIRYPVTNDAEKMFTILAEIVEKSHFKITHFSDLQPHYVDEENVLIQTLKKVYEEQTGEKAELLSIGGGTYARSLKSGVAFGPLFPGRLDIAHQKNEYIMIDDLLKATAIYAQAIYELAR